MPQFYQITDGTLIVTKSLEQGATGSPLDEIIGCIELVDDVETITSFPMHFINGGDARELGLPLKLVLATDVSINASVLRRVLLVFSALLKGTLLLGDTQLGREIVVLNNYLSTAATASQPDSTAAKDGR